MYVMRCIETAKDKRTFNTMVSRFFLSLSMDQSLLCPIAVASSPARTRLKSCQMNLFGFS